MASIVSKTNTNSPFVTTSERSSIRSGYVMKNDWMVVCGTACVGCIFAVLLTLIFQPIPQIQDEFAYLLTAETFASGRLTNPTHPHWQHFESMQIIHQPSYNAKYPPGQSMALALGQVIGHPIFGACLATAISMGALMWMLLGWLPKLNQQRGTLLFCLLVITTHPGLQIIWGQSFMGGAVALTGGALLLGALPRLFGELKVTTSTYAALGISLLVISRPFEGAVLTLCVGIAFTWKLFQNQDWNLRKLVSRVVVPTIVVGSATGSMFLAYNSQVTGNAFTLPYSVHESTYGWNKVFLWQTPVASSEYRHAAMFDFFEDDVLTTEEKFGNAWVATASHLDTLLQFLLFFFGCSLILGLLGIPIWLREPNAKLALAVLIPGVLTVFVTPWGHPHYLAPFAPLILLISIGGLLGLWQQRSQLPMVRKWNWRMFAVVHVAWIVIVGTKAFQEENSGWHQQRFALTQQLTALPGKDLVFVRYSENHNVHAEWIYNSADIDSSEIIWAREISPQMDKNLCNYFSDRKIWYVNADAVEVEPQPYQAATPVKS